MYIREACSETNYTNQKSHVKPTSKKTSRKQNLYIEHKNINLTRDILGNKQNMSLAIPAIVAWTPWPISSENLKIGFFSPWDFHLFTINRSQSKMVRSLSWLPSLLHVCKTKCKPTGKSVHVILVRKFLPRCLTSDTWPTYFHFPKLICKWLE